MENLAPPNSGRSEIFKGSKSFSLASLFFNRRQKHGAWALYRWCRHVDDEIDLAAPQEILTRLQTVRTETAAAFAQSHPISGVYQSLHWAVQNFSIQESHAQELIAGLEWDSRGARIENEDELLQYCYYVAGTVGLMMCKIMGVKNPVAFPHAEALGKAMQLTNIARDLNEDLQRHRVYIPIIWLAQKNISLDEFKSNPEIRAIFALKLIKLAEKYYAIGFAGVRYLPFRAALAVSSAAYIYRSIGMQILKDPVYYQTHRAVVPLYKKLFWIARGFLFTIKSRGQ